MKTSPQEKRAVYQPENTTNLERIATICKFVVNDPETHIDTIPLIIKALEHKYPEHRTVVMLSLVKVFKNIIPLYKVRLHTKKVKGPGGYEYIKPFDKKVLQYYTLFVKRILEYSEISSYKAACHLLESVDHFNLADKLVAKVLRGTLCEPTRDLCRTTLLKKLRENARLETISIVVNEMQSLNFDPSTLQILLEISILDRTLDDNTVQISKNDKIYSKSIIENVIRIYLQVLRHGHSQFYTFAFLGLQKYKHLIREEFYEGVYILLRKILKCEDRIAKLACVSCIAELFHSRGYDTIEAIDALYSLLLPVEEEVENATVDLVEKLFVSKRQPENRARNLVQRLMQLCLFKFAPNIKRIISKLEAIYRIDFRDMHIIGSGSYVQDAKRIEQTIEKPFYEYFLYRNTI